MAERLYREATQDEINDYVKRRPNALSMDEIMAVRVTEPLMTRAEWEATIPDRVVLYMGATKCVFPKVMVVAAVGEEDEKPSYYCVLCGRFNNALKHDCSGAAVRGGRR